MTSSLSNEEALKLFNKTEGVMERYFGEGVFASDDIRPIPRTSSGIFVVDYILGGMLDQPGLFGLPKGGIVEVFGPESTGKTTFAAQCAVAYQRTDPEHNRVLYLDFEHTVSKRYFKQLGMVTDRPHLILTQPTTLEEGAFIAKHLMTQGLVDFIVCDTPAASQPALIVNAPLSEKEMREGYRDIDKGKSDVGQIGIHARTFSHALAALVPLVAKTGTVLIFPNQIRTTINTYGAGETTPGGRSLKFHASIRIRLSKKETKKESLADDITGTKRATAVENLIQFHTIKNKTHDPFRLVEVRLAYGRGFLDVETTVDLGVKRKIIDKVAGGNFTSHDGNKVRGTEELLAYYNKPDNYEGLKAKIVGTTPTDDEYREVPDGVDIDDDADKDELPTQEGKVAL